MNTYALQYEREKIPPISKAYLRFRKTARGVLLVTTHENHFWGSRELIAQEIGEVFPNRPFLIKMANCSNKTVDIKKGMRVAPAKKLQTFGRNHHLRVLNLKRMFRRYPTT